MFFLLSTQKPLPFWGAVCDYEDLQPGIAVGIDQCIQTAALLAVGALLVVVAGVVRNILDRVDGADRVAVDLVHSAVDCRDTHCLAAIVAHSLDALVGGIAGGTGGHEDQHMLVTDHGLDVVAEDHLGVGVVLGLHHINGIVRVHAAEAALGQLLRQAGADDRGAVQTQNGIHGRIILKGSHQILGSSLGFAEPGLGIGDVDIIVNMAVVGGKMATGNTQRGIAALYRQIGDLDHSSILHK